MTKRREETAVTKLAQSISDMANSRCEPRAVLTGSKLRNAVADMIRNTFGVVTRDECEDVLCAIAAARAERVLGEGRVVELKEGQILAASGDDGLTVHYQGPCRLTITRLPDKEPEKVRPVVVEGWLWDKGVLEAKGLWCPKCRWISPEDVTICDRCGASFGEPCDLPEVPDER